MATDDLRRGLPIRTACDPAVAYSRARTLCAHFPDPSYRVDLYLASRRSSEPLLRFLVDLTDFCSHPPGSSGWRHNAWISVN